MINGATFSVRHRYPSREKAAGPSLHPFTKRITHQKKSLPIPKSFPLIK